MTNWYDWFTSNVDESGDSIASAHYDSERSFYIRQQVVYDWLGDISGKTILDVGVATGHFCESLTKHNRVIGVDFVPKMLQYAAKKDILPIQADGMILPLPKQSIDVIVCVGVLQHIDDVDNFLAELLRVRKSGGELYLITLNADSLIRKLYYALPQNTETMHTYQIPDLIKRIQRIVPLATVEAATIYYPFPGYRRVGQQAGIQRYLSTVLAIRVSGA